MNWLEKNVYDLIKNNPRMKIRIRNAYQRMFDLLPPPHAKQAYEIIPREGFFFGYHDHTPFSSDNSRLLANRFDIPLRMPTARDELEVGYFSGVDYRNYKPIARTKAWMWHMGCKAQWRGSSHEIVFNDHIDGQNIARIVDSNSGQTVSLPDSIASVSPDGNYAVGYSFARVEECMPGYGYVLAAADPEKGSKRPKKNGIHLINLTNKERRLLYSIDELAQIQPDSSMREAHHFVTHAVFSPDSKRFVFLHRWVQISDLTKRWSRLISCDLDGHNLCLFPAQDMVSHIGWRNADAIIAYCRVPHYGDQYVLFNVDQPLAYEIVGRAHFNSDGHPSFDPSGRWMVTDTYPDRRRVQNLVLYDLYDSRRYDIARLPTPAQYQSSLNQHWCCDLHPRWDRTGTLISFDSTYTGTRSLCTLNLGDDLRRTKIRTVDRSTAYIQGLQG
jgi:hypothetical protein